MGLFAISIPGDNIEECLSAVKCNLKFYEESMGGEYEGGSEYLLHMAHRAVENAISAHHRKYPNTIQTQK